MHIHIHAKANPDKPAYIMAGTGKVVTYGQLEERSNRLAQYFRKIGLKKGDHIALLMENHPDFYVVVWAAQRSGLLTTPISTQFSADEVAYIVNDCDAACLIVSAKGAEIAAAIVDQTPAVRARLIIDGTLPGHESFEAVLAAMPAQRIADEAAGVNMVYSSGTTGRPKGVKPAMPTGAVDEWGPGALAMMGMAQIDGNAVYLSPAPLYHAAPLGWNMLVMIAGGTCIIMEKFDPETSLKLIEQYQATHSQWVPTMFIRMLKLDPAIRNKYRTSSMRFAIHAAAPCPKEVKKQMIDWWGPVIYEYYAGSEANGLTFIMPDDWLKHEGTVGRAVFGELRIVDDEHNEVPVGEIGTICFANGPQFSYHKDPAKTASISTRQGWTTLGDVGYMDAEGYLYLTDRKNFMIISGGVNIYPQEVESLLALHPGVADLAVIGVPHEEFGEEVKAVVQPARWEDAGPALANELMEYCRARLSHLKCPRSVDFVQELPRTPTGKLLKRLVRDKYWTKPLAAQ